MSQRKRRPRLTRTAWARNLEAITGQQPVTDEIGPAQRAFAALPREEQLRLTRELVETRAAELCRAYPDVIDVAYGYRTQSRRGGRRVVRRPCVTFVVKRKWTSRRQRVAGRTLPEHVFAYGTVRGTRRLCAIPTDVESAEIYYKVRPQLDPRFIAMVHEGTAPEKGVITCTLRRAEVPDELFALSCQHVFGLVAQLYPQAAVGARVHLDRSTSAVVVGRSRAQRGRFQEDDLSFDAQLAQVTDVGALRSALNGLRFSTPRYVKTQEDVPDRYWIRTPRGLIEASKVRFVLRRSITYGEPDRSVTIVHLLLLESHVSEETKGGDSGSPLVTGEDGGTLIGMHIAGGGSVSYAIPAWQLLDVGNYIGIGDSDTLTLINP